MADESTSQRAPDAAPDSGQANRTSARPDSGTAAPAKADKAVNLYELEDFKKVQASWQAKQQEMQRQLQQERQRFEQAQRKLQQAEEAGLSDYDKLQRELQRKEEALKQREEQLQQVEAEREAMRRKDQDLEWIASKFGVSKAELLSAENFDEAFDRAKQLAEQKQDAQSRARDEKRAAIRPDTGGGGLSTADSRRESDFAGVKTAQEAAKLWFSPRE